MKKNTIIISLIALAIILIGLGGFYGADAQSADTAGLDVSGVTDSEASVIAAKFVRQIGILDSVKLDQDKAIFTKDTFKALIDWSRPIPEEAAGRDNPFAPIQ